MGETLLAGIDPHIDQTRPFKDTFFVVNHQVIAVHRSKIENRGATVETEINGHPPVWRGVWERGVQRLAIGHDNITWIAYHRHRTG